MVIDSMSDEDIENIRLPKSKSQIKREMVELQELGERLVLLNRDKLSKLELPTLLFEAIIEAKKITSRGGKRRQLQYIGRLMRDLEDTSLIRDFFAELDSKHQRVNAIHHMLESWREKLLSDDSEILTEFIALFPAVDRQHLRQLIQNGRKERLYGKPVGASKQLFRYLKELHQENPVGDKM